MLSTILIDKIGAKYSVYQSSSVALITAFENSLVYEQPRNSTSLNINSSKSLGKILEAAAGVANNVSIVLQVPYRCVLAFIAIATALSISAESSK